MNFKRLLVLTSVIVCFKFTIQSGVKVSLELVSFKNPNNKDLNGKCCEQTCSRCDYYFRVCLKDSTSGGCLLDITTKTWGSTNDIVFLTGKGALGNNHDNPLVKELSAWKGKLIVDIKVWDKDTISSNDLVDKYYINKLVTPTAGTVQQTWTTINIKGIPSTMALRYSVQCYKHYYGPSCTKYCLARDNNQGHYTCDLKTGEKVCINGWYGKDCLTYCIPKNDDKDGHYTCDDTGQKVCLADWYGPTCTAYCKPHNDSSAGYSCDNHGNKICLPNWYPRNKCDVYCYPSNDSTSGYTCDQTTGQKTCLSGWHGPECDCSPRNDTTASFECNKTTGERICNLGWHGTHCNVFCIPRNDSLFGHYTCNPSNGAKECLRYWFGKRCDVYCPPSNETSSDSTTMCSVNNTLICARNWYGMNCSIHCEPRDDDAGHYQCNEQTGQKVCLHGWYGENCSTHCIPRDNDWFGHYDCDINGTKKCHEHWFGPDCKTFCHPQNSSLLGYFQCKDDGTRVCLENWYGPKCLEYCKGRDDDEGHYRCGADGDVFCLENWFGVNCTTYCMPSDNAQGHYTCDPRTGEEVCMDGWTGTNCKDEATVIEPTSTVTKESQSPPKSREKTQRQAAHKLSELSLALILGGFLLLLCVTVGVVIIICSRKQTKRSTPFPYLRYKNTATEGSLERAADIVRKPQEPEPEAQLKRQSRIPNLLAKYDDNVAIEQKQDVVINLQEISWNQDGSRNVDEKLVMYNNPLFIERNDVNPNPAPRPDPRVDPKTGLRDNSDWVAIFDSYVFE